MYDYRIDWQSFTGAETPPAIKILNRSMSFPLANAVIFKDGSTRLRHGYGPEPALADIELAEVASIRNSYRPAEVSRLAVQTIASSNHSLLRLTFPIL